MSEDRPMAFPALAVIVVGSRRRCVFEMTS